MTDSPSERPRAYSYVRFSTPSQSKGDSYRRQTEKAVRYAAEHGLELDTELALTDLGVSGYRLKNARTGALRSFLQAVEDGLVLQGSYLLVENMDRLTRAEIMGALGLFSEIINAGITLVTLTNGEAYSKEKMNSEPHQIYYIVAELIRANHESSRKGQLVSDAKEAKRQRLANGVALSRPYSRIMPAWIRWDDGSKTYQLIADRAALVEELFKRADEGWGMDRIARHFNARGEATWENGTRRRSAHWRGAYLRRIATSKAPLGYFTPHKTTHDEKTNTRRDLPLDPVRLWPASVSEELYWRVNRRFQTKAPRGKYANGEVRSLVQGLSKCTCGASVIRVSKGKSRGKTYVYLVCSKAHAKGACEYLPVRLEDVEQALRTQMAAVVHDAPRGRDTEELDRQISNLQENLEAQETALLSLVQFAADERTPASRMAVRQREQAVQDLRQKLLDYRAQRETLTPASVSRRLVALDKALTSEPWDIKAANSALRQAFRDIVVRARDAALVLHWHHTDEFAHVTFYSRHADWSEGAREY